MADSVSGGWSGSMRGWRRGCSCLASTILGVPLVEGLSRRMRHLAIFAPGVQAVVDHKARQARQRVVGSLDRRPIHRRTRKQGARGFHGGAFDERRLVLSHQDLAPGVNLLVNIDLYRTDVGATAVQRR